MNNQFLTMKSQIKSELNEIATVVNRIEKAWQKQQKTADELYLDSVALNLHSFYAGFERIFELIAREIDGSIPDGSAWHQNLLRQMSIEIEKVRPQIISKKTQEKLDEYRSFRHVIRNIYSFNISKDKLKPLVENINHTFKDADKDINIFLNEMEAEG
ncbi:MAG: hypothetical protein ABR596_06795 [Halarsenatibacteraceae bacterium]